MIFISGTRCSGKNSLANTLEDNGYFIFDTGQYIRCLFKKDSDRFFSIDQWVSYNELKLGKDFTNNLILNRLKKVISHHPVNRIVVVGFRSIQGILYIINNLNLVDYNIIYVTAPKYLLYSRFMKRGRESFMSKKEFYNQIENEEKTLVKIKINASVVINNEDMAVANNELMDFFKNL